MQHALEELRNVGAMKHPLLTPLPCWHGCNGTPVAIIPIF